jgi:hypothetical protein
VFDSSIESSISLVESSFASIDLKLVVVWSVLEFSCDSKFSSSELGYSTSFVLLYVFPAGQRGKDATTFSVRGIVFKGFLVSRNPS